MALGGILKRRGLGYLPDLPDHRDRDIDKLGIGSSKLPGNVALPVREVLDQGRTNTCVAQAIAQAVRVKTEEELLSRLAIYWNARAYHAATKRDDGTHIRLAIRALQRYGAPPERVWPFDVSLLSSKLNKKPSLASYQLGHDFGGVRGYYRIFDTGLAKLLAIKAAIASGRPVVAGWHVDGAFVADDGPALIDVPTGPAIGGHAMAIVGYTEDAFEVVNSWGTRWRQDGFAYFTPAMVMEAIDVWAIDC